MFVLRILRGKVIKMEEGGRWKGSKAKKRFGLAWGWKWCWRNSQTTPGPDGNHIKKKQKRGGDMEEERDYNSTRTGEVYEPGSTRGPTIWARGRIEDHGDCQPSEKGWDNGCKAWLKPDRGWRKEIFVKIIVRKNPDRPKKIVI